MTAARAQRSTRQRAAVSAMLDTLSDFRSAQELHDALRRSGDPIGLTTVYRALQSLVDAGEVDVLRTGTGEAVYRRCASVEHHHHLVCRKCGHTVEIDGPAVETWAQKVAEQHGFSDLSHTAEIFGLCRDCTSGAAASDAASHNDTSGAADRR